MEEYKYKLEPYNGSETQHYCPNCNSREKSFVRYIDTDTGEYIADDVGICNRRNKCEYHYPPREYFADNPKKQKFLKNNATKKKILKQDTVREIQYVPLDILEDSLQHNEKNNLIEFLIDLFGNELTESLIEKYFIGTSNHWDGATIFWQIDITEKIRTGKIMLYNSITGKRIKEPFNHITWVHKLINQTSFKQCFFGEHLIAGNNLPIAIVESEKTAIIASAYLPQFIWLACGSLNNLSEDRCKVLNGRNVTLYPDLRGFDAWNIKAKKLGFDISDLLEREASDEEKEEGLDLADFLIQYEINSFV
jgi:hypothetical protein